MSWYYYLIFFFVGCVIARILWMVFDISKPQTISRSYTRLGDYRIKPEYDGSFQVQEYDHYHWMTAGFNSHLYESTRFKTEQEAEAWIHKKLEERRKVDEARRKQEEFYRMNPPREVPPFKFSHGPGRSSKGKM